MICSFFDRRFNGTVMVLRLLSHLYGESKAATHQLHGRNAVEATQVILRLLPQF